MVAFDVRDEHPTSPVELPRRASRELLARQSAILARAASGEPVGDLLDPICRMIEDPVAGTTCTILLVDGLVLRHGAAPGMPTAFVEAIDGEAWGPDRGSCGTAVHTRQPTLTADIATDPRWEPWRPLALGLGFRACWSVPVVSRDGEVLATFAAYSTTPRLPLEDELELLRMAAHLVAVLLEQQRDRDALRRATTQLVTSNEELLAAGRAKDDFLSMTSHELRTPLTPMIGMIETLQLRWDQLDDDARLSALAVVARHAERLHHLVDDLLTMSAATAGELHPVPRTIDLLPAVERTIETAVRADVAVDVSIPPGTVVRSDARHLEQMLENYLTNAMKYAPGSALRVTASRVGDTTEIRVTDRGPGIDPGLAERLFEPFVQLDAGDRRSVGGTGLGLAIVRRLAAANRGRAWHEPADGGGACFVLSLPTGEPDDA